MFRSVVGKALSPSTRSRPSSIRSAVPVAVNHFRRSSSGYRRSPEEEQSQKCIEFQDIRGRGPLYKSQLLELDTDPKHARRQWRELLAHFDRNQEVIQRLWDERQALEQQHQALEQKHHALKQKYQELQEQHHALGSLSWALEQRCEDATIDLEQREMLHESAQRLEADRATHQLSLQFQSRLSGQHIRVLQAKLKKLQGELEQSRSQLEAGEAEAEGEKAKKAESETEKAESKARAKENVDSAYFVVMAGLYTLVGVVMVDRLHHLFTEG